MHEQWPHKKKKKLPSITSFFLIFTIDEECSLISVSFEAYSTLISRNRINYLTVVGYRIEYRSYVSAR